MDEFNDDVNVEEEEPRRKPWIWILAIFLILIFVLSVFPYYGIKRDPRPYREINLEQLYINENNYTRLKNFDEVKSFQLSPVVKNSANKIGVYSCRDSNNICYAKAFFYFVRDNIQYVSDPEHEYIQSPEETLYSGGGDCEDMTILLAMLMKSVGIDSRIVLTSNHAFLEIYLEDAMDSYKVNDYIGLDPTCSYCEFGEVMPNYRKDVINYVYL